MSGHHQPRRYRTLLDRGIAERHVRRTRAGDWVDVGHVTLLGCYTLGVTPTVDLPSEWNVNLGGTISTVSVTAKGTSGRKGLGGHLPALLSGPAAHVGTLAHHVVVELVALLRAGVAGVRDEPAELTDELLVAGQQRQASEAQRGGVQAQPCTAHHLLLGAAK
jgi:hypothetical protein